MTFALISSYAVLTFAALLLAIEAWTLWRLRRLREQGAYPAKGQETAADAQRLAIAGHHLLAMRCYRAATGASLKQAKTAVTAMR